MKTKNGEAIIQNIWQWLQHPSLAVLLFCINLLLVLPALLPVLDEINRVGRVCLHHYRAAACG